MIRFCKQCGSQVSYETPPGDTLPRHVCNDCGHIHYENPRLVVGCIAEWDGKILLCRRAIEPRLGCWTLPAGFMENGETTAQAAARETLEEAGAEVAIDSLYTMFSIPRINQVHLFYRGTLPDPQYEAGEESLEVELFPLDDIPWSELAFHSVEATLRHYLHDRSINKFSFHEAALEPMGLPSPSENP